MEKKMTFFLKFYIKNPSLHAQNPVLKKVSQY